MRNPLESEEAAFRFLLGTIAYFALIVVAAWIWAWLGVAVFALATVAAFLLIRGRRAPEAAQDEGATADVADTPDAGPMRPTR